MQIEPKDPEKRINVETFIQEWISVLNEMVAAINEVTSESHISLVYDSILEFIRENKEEPENLALKNLLYELRKKIKSYASMHGLNRIPILANFAKFHLMLKKEYEVLSVECSEGSIFLLLTFSSIKGYEDYKKDLENGRIGEQILELLLYPPFLESFGLKADDIEISLNGSLLTQPKGKEDVEQFVMLISGLYMMHNMQVYCCRTV